MVISLVKSSWIVPPWVALMHASLLPKYRGASPIETALANGDVETGVTLMRMVRKMDAGPLIGQEAVQITSEDTGTSLRKKLADSCFTTNSKVFE